MTLERWYLGIDPCFYPISYPKGNENRLTFTLEPLHTGSDPSLLKPVSDWKIPSEYDFALERNFNMFFFLFLFIFDLALSALWVLEHQSWTLEQFPFFGNRPSIVFCFVFLAFPLVFFLFFFLVFS